MLFTLESANKTLTAKRKTHLPKILKYANKITIFYAIRKRVQLVTTQTRHSDLLYTAVVVGSS